MGRLSTSQLHLKFQLRLGAAALHQDTAIGPRLETMIVGFRYHCRRFYFKAKPSRIASSFAYFQMMQIVARMGHTSVLQSCHIEMLDEYHGDIHMTAPHKDVLWREFPKTLLDFKERFAT